MLRQWNLSWNEKFDLNLESDELFCVWVDHKPINPLNTPTPTLLLVSSTEDLKTVPNLRFDSKPVQINLLFQSYIHLVAFPSEWASSIIGWNNHWSTTGFCFVLTSTTWGLFCCWMNNMVFVLFQCQQHGCQNWQQLVRQREIAWLLARLRESSHARFTWFNKRMGWLAQSY